MEIFFQYITLVAFIFIRYSILAGIPFLLVYKIFTNKMVKAKIQKKIASKKDFLREVKHSLITSAAFGTTAMIVFFTPFKEYTNVYSEISDFSLIWLPISVVLSLIIHDTYFYWMHRILHHPKLFRTTHLVHHQSINPSPWASQSFHIIESFLEAFIVVVLVFIMPIHPLAIALFGLMSFIINVYGHLGYEVAPKWFRHSVFFEMINSSVHHNLHHSKFKGNYGLYFRFWDRVMGTENPKYVEMYDKIQMQRFPNDVLVKGNSQQSTILEG